MWLTPARLRPLTTWRTSSQLLFRTLLTHTALPATARPTQVNSCVVLVLWGQPWLTVVLFYCWDLWWRSLVIQDWYFSQFSVLGCSNLFGLLLQMDCLLVVFVSPAKQPNRSTCGLGGTQEVLEGAILGVVWLIVNVCESLLWWSFRLSNGTACYAAFHHNFLITCFSLVLTDLLKYSKQFYLATCRGRFCAFVW